MPAVRDSGPVRRCHALVLEELEHAKARGATIYAELIGFGTSGDAFHMTRHRPMARKCSTCCITNALRDAKTASTAQYITTALTRPATLPKPTRSSVFGEHAYKLAVSSTKSMTGHLRAGASRDLSALAINSRGTANYHLDEPDEGCDLRFRAAHCAQQGHRCRAVDSSVLAAITAPLTFRRFAG